MRHAPTVAVLIFIPMYVLSVFVADVFAPTQEFIYSEEVFTISIVGDMMFDRYVRERAEHGNGYNSVLSQTFPLHADSNVVIGNLEGPISTFASVSDWRTIGPNHYTFTFATTVSAALLEAGFSAVNLANNHSMNFGVEGLAQTKYWLAKNGIAHFGAPDTPYEPWRYSSGTVPVVFYAFDSQYARDFQSIAEKIQSEDDHSFVIVYAHWGDEYELEPNAGQRELAHVFVDAGADLVVGTHPHVVQPKERYNGAWIYYSLGNFVFDQYFNEAVSCGAVLHVHISEDGTYTTSESFIRLQRDGTTKVADCMAEVPLE